MVNSDLSPPVLCPGGGSGDVWHCNMHLKIKLMIFVPHKREQLLRNLSLLIVFICCVSVQIILGLVGLFPDCCLISVFPSNATAGGNCR